MEFLLEANDPSYLATLYSIQDVPEFYERHGVTREEAAMVYASWDWETAGIQVNQWVGTLRWMKGYSIYPEMVGKNGSGLTSTGTMKHIWNLLWNSEEMADDCISWEYPLIPAEWGSEYQDLALAVDCTHTGLTGVAHEFDDGSHPWWSWKKRHNGQTWQCVIDILDHKIVDVYGPFPATVNDQVMWAKSGCSEWLQNNQRCLGDAGYWWSPGVLANCPRSLLPCGGPMRAHWKKVGKFISQKRWLIESFFARIKWWNSIGGVWRHEPEKQKPVFKLATALWNLSNKTLAKQFTEDDDTDIESMGEFEYDRDESDDSDDDSDEMESEDEYW
eukprot:TRINITY_DN65130_c0_g1_i3.p1 TRINITY_DN65130_c0_g1~~TRINITY_DN65130_c0_g1_i3.p1  ORF type:complete len:331 (-),score=39.05 TRINITY_DN65130_c0_g1_i3:76-1068(-)